MTLINIDYGSLASSEIMNKNFLYLDEKIAQTAESINTSISSVLSNIATINSRFGDVSEEIDAASETSAVELENAKEEVSEALVTAQMLPNWGSCIYISRPEYYIAPSNGYVLLMPTTTSNGNLVVNGVTVSFKKVSSGNDYASILVSMPVKKGEVFTCTANVNAAYFLPVVEGGI